MTELAKEDVAERMRYWYERAVDEQKKELRGSLSFAYASNMYHRVNDISNRLFCSGNRNRKYAA